MENKNMSFYNDFKNFLKKAKKTIGKILASLLVLALLAGIMTSLNEIKDRKLNEGVKMNVVYDYEKKNCTDDEYPLLIGFRNDTNETVKSIDFSLDITKTGYSEDISNSKFLNSSKIIEPGEEYYFCYKYKLDYGYESYYRQPALLDFSIGYRNIEFY